MATNIAERLAAEGKPPVDIAALDWKEGAAPISQINSVGDTRPEKLRKEAIAVTGGLVVLSAVVGSDQLEKSVDFVGDVISVKPSGLLQGQWLSNWLKAEATAGRITVAEQVQIIGHSAGGFVAGEAGLRAIIPRKETRRTQVLRSIRALACPGEHTRPRVSFLAPRLKAENNHRRSRILKVFGGGAKGDTRGACAPQR